MTDALHRGREAYERRAWMDAHEALAAADRAVALGIGRSRAAGDCRVHVRRDDVYLSYVKRAYQLHLDADAPLRAVRCAF